MPASCSEVRRRFRQFRFRQAHTTQTVHDIARFHTDYVTHQEDREPVYRSLRYVEDTLAVQPTRPGSEHLLHCALVVLLQLALPKHILCYESQMFPDDPGHGMDDLRIMSL